MPLKKMPSRRLRDVTGTVRDGSTGQTLSENSSKPSTVDEHSGVESDSHELRSRSVRTKVKIFGTPALQVIKKKVPAVRQKEPKKADGQGKDELKLSRPSAGSATKRYAKKTVAFNPAKRTVAWYEAITDYTAKPNTSRERPVFSLFNSPGDEYDSLPDPEWPEETDDIVPVTSKDSTKTFRMSIGIPMHQNQSPRFVPSNAGKASARLNFEGYLQNERRLKLKRPAKKMEGQSIWGSKETHVAVVGLSVLAEESMDSESDQCDL